MTSLGQWFGGGRRGDYDPWFGSELWDPSGLGANIGQDKYRGDETTALANAQVDWRETDDAHVFHVDLPGVRKEEVKVQVEDGNILQISGERTKEQKDVNDKWHRVERRRGSFVRRFRLPENAHLDDIKSFLDHGVLTVTVPKKPMDQTSRNVRYIDVA